MMGSRPDGALRPPWRFSGERRFNVEGVEIYTSVLAVLIGALLLVAAGMGTKLLVWKPKPVPFRRRRRR
jgi:hypothetical protein